MQKDVSDSNNHLFTLINQSLEQLPIFAGFLAQMMDMRQELLIKECLHDVSCPDVWFRLYDNQSTLLSCVSSVMNELIIEGNSGKDIEVEESIFATEMGRFFFTVLIPSVVLYREWPWVLMRQAKEGDLDAIEKLLRHDMEIFKHPEIYPHLEEMKIQRPKLFERKIAKALAYTAQRITKDKVKIAVMALGIEYFHQLSNALPKQFKRKTTPDLQRLFDENYAQEKNQRGARDPHLPYTADAMRKAVQRERPKIRHLLDSFNSEWDKKEG